MFECCRVPITGSKERVQHDDRVRGAEGDQRHVADEIRQPRSSGWLRAPLSQ
jgi:hypothetical protein